MIIDQVSELQQLEKAQTKRPAPTKVLMVSPEYFDVEYAINPHMLDAQGNLQKIDRAKARAQWQALKLCYEKIGLKVQVIPGVQGYPDMVFCANTSFPFLDAQGKKKVLSVKMHSDLRKGEVAPVLNWYKKDGYDLIQLKSPCDFEGNGDALPHEKWILGGHGFRTERQVYHEIAELTKLPVIALKLVSEHFYHLDTCLSILDHETIALVKEGFAPESLELLKILYPRIIFIDKDEAIKSFSGNAHCPDGRNVILQAGAKKFGQKLREKNFQVHEVDTSEYIKSGGSVFCMKMMCY